MSGKPKKYVFDNGVMKINPKYNKWKAAQSGVANPKVKAGKEPLAIVSSMEDVADASNQQYEKTGTSLQLAESTAASLEIIQDDEYVEEFQQPDGNLDGTDLLEGLTNYFVKFEIPVGLVNKLMALQMYNLRFIVDDSGSMNAKTDSYLSDASDYVLRGQKRSSKKCMTRWQEAETRLHNMMDILVFIPTKSINISFLNAKNVISLQRAGKTTEEFMNIAHTEIARNFSSIPVRYKTPTLRVMTQSFTIASSLPDPTMHYLLTDGVPSDSVVKQVADLIHYRKNPEGNPVTLISCTDQDDEAEWMKEVEEVAPFCSEIDDFNDEKREVAKDQGVAFPYTKGYWLICQLVSAINPNDLDAIDETIPFTKNTLDNLLGRIHTSQEYKYYFDRNPNKKKYLHLYDRFLNDQTFARNIVRNQNDSKIPTATAIYC